MTNQAANPITAAKQSIIDMRAVCIFFIFAIFWTLIFPHTQFLQDQITYTIKSLIQIDHALYANDTVFCYREIVNPYLILTATYPLLLAFLHSMVPDLIGVYRIIHFLIVFIYLMNIYVLLRYLRFGTMEIIEVIMPRFTFYDWYGLGGVDTLLPRAFGFAVTPLS